MSDQAHPRPTVEHETNPEAVDGTYSPEYRELTAEEHDMLSVSLRRLVVETGASTMGDAVLEFTPDKRREAVGMTRLFNTAAADHPGVAANLAHFGDDPETALPVMIFTGAEHPSTVTDRGNLAMTELNALLKDVQSPLRFPKQ